MENPLILKGLGAVLNINTNTPTFRFLFHDLSMRAIDTIDPSDAHVSLFSSYDTRFPIFNDKDEEALNDASIAVGERLEAFEVKEWSVSPKGCKVDKLDRSREKVGVYIAEIKALGVIRDELDNVSAAASHGKVRIRNDRPFEPHLTLGTITDDYYKERRAFSLEQRNKIMIPGRFLVRNYEVSTRTFEVYNGDAVKPECQTQRFRNVPAYVRRTM